VLAHLFAIGVLWTIARPPDATLDFGHSIAKVTRVVIDGKPGEWIDARRVRVSGDGFKKVEVTYLLEGKASRVVQYIGFAPGVELKIQDHNGAIIVRQLPGPRCGRVDGTRQKWVLCEGIDLALPVGTPFELDCSSSIDLGANHLFWIHRGDGDDSPPSSPVFVPTLPGLYSARYAAGRISISYTPSDCAGATSLRN
jgi:hypothetical protein